LPNGVAFGGEITKEDENIAALKLWITNGSAKELKEALLLTCVYLNSLKEFDKETNNNKFIHTSGKGWIPLPTTEGMDSVANGYKVGWLKEAKPYSDLPVVVVKSEIDGHLLAFTWFDNTRSFIGNPNHPCVHADPVFHDLIPGESQTINGELIFFEGTLQEFETMFRERLRKKGTK